MGTTAVRYLVYYYAFNGKGMQTVPRYVKKCTASPVRYRVSEWTWKREEARLFTYQSGATVRRNIPGDAGVMERVNITK